jgi:hypothetical protein
MVSSSNWSSDTTYLAVILAILFLLSDFPKCVGGRRVTVGARQPRKSVVNSAELSEYCFWIAAQFCRSYEALFYALAKAAGDVPGNSVIHPKVELGWAFS